jgi:hypothetical protein
MLANLEDFNLIYKARDKNNRNLNLQLMLRFRRTIDFCQFKEIKLQNRKYTWSNERRRPTLVRLDKVFCNQSWDMTFDAPAPCTPYLPPSLTTAPSSSPTNQARAVRRLSNSKTSGPVSRTFRRLLRKPGMHRPPTLSLSTA